MDRMLTLMQDVTFLALVTWREARGEVRDGRVAVMHSIMNRVHRPSWWGNDLLSVIGKRWQYSSMTATGDPQLVVLPSPSDPRWMECMDDALRVILGEAGNPAPGADSYYAAWMDEKGQTPKWADPKKFVVQIGNHKFYNLDSDQESA